MSPLGRTTGPFWSSAQTGWLLEWVVRAALFVAILVYFVPLAPGMPGYGLDSSWVLAMGHAFARGLIPGRDLAFTFGPYSAIFTRGYHPASDTLTCLAAFYLALSYAATLFLVVRRDALAVQVTLLVALSAAFYTRDALFVSYPLLFAILCYRLVDVQSRSAIIDLDRPSGVALLAILVAPLGLFPLIKGSLILVCGGTLALVVMLFVSLRRVRLALLLVLVALTSLSVFWVLAEGSLTTMPLYFKAMQPAIAGYSEAMQNEGPPNEWQFYLIAALLVLAVLGHAVRNHTHRGEFIVLAYALFLFVTFKAGFVRQRGHSIVASEGLLLATLYLYGLGKTRGFAIAMACSALVWIYIDGNAFNLSSKTLLTNPTTYFTNAFGGLIRRIENSGSLKHQFDDSLAAIRNHGKLPKLAGTSDIYPWDQSDLIAAGNDWDPRPTFQSYAAYTPSLAVNNRDHLLGTAAPDNIFFRVDTFDQRFPALDDGASWPVLLSYYRAERMQDNFLILRRASGTKPLLRDLETTLAVSTRQLDQEVVLPDSSAPLMVELYFKRSTLGRLVDLLFKPANLSITVRMENGEVKRFRMISGMSETGFLISPMIESTEDFAYLFGGMGYLAGKRVRSFSISAPVGKNQWQPDYRVVFKALKFDATADVATLFSWNQPVIVPETSKIVMRSSCDDNIDSISGKNEAAGDVLSIAGWAAQSVKTGILADQVLIALLDGHGRHHFYSTAQIRRPDVASYFDKKALVDAGFSSTIDVKGLTGRFSIALALAHDGQIDLCPPAATLAR